MNAIRLRNELAALSTDLQNLTAQAGQQAVDGHPLLAAIRRRLDRLERELPALPVVRRTRHRFGYAGHLLVYGATSVGFGDVLQPLQVVAELAANAGIVTLASSPPLVELMRESVRYLPSVRVVREGTSVPGVTTYASWLSLRVNPRYNCPHGKPFLKAPNGSVSLPTNTQHIGICWASHYLDPTRCRRSTTIKVFVDAFRALLPDVTLHSLMPDRPRQLDPYPTIIRHDFADFTDSARLVSALDCVVTVDAAAAHLAAGLGVPTLNVIGPGQDGRYPKSGLRYAWYDSMHLIHTYGTPRTADDPNGMAPGVRDAVARVKRGELPPRLPFYERPMPEPDHLDDVGTDWQLFREDLDRFDLFASVGAVAPRDVEILHAGFAQVAARLQALAA